MKTIQEAFDIINQNIPLNTGELIPLSESLGRILSEDQYSTINMPPFNQSAMDGYAVNLPVNVEFKHQNFKLIGEIKAGDDASSIKLDPFEAIRIFTGAMVPGGTTHVAQQEIVILNKDEINIEKELKDFANIRPLSEQISKGDLICEKGVKLTTGLIGYLASLGISELPCYSLPKTAVLTTGDELQVRGKDLLPGQVYESNAVMLEVLLQEVNIMASPTHAPDNFDLTKIAIKKASHQHDVLIITGGISVGDYDFVGKALNELNAKELFYKIKQKPGKPIYFGQLNNCFIFALPGNPAAVYTCFHMYVKPALRLFQGYDPKDIRDFFKAHISHDFERKGNRPQFLKGIYKNSVVTVLGQQSSAMLGAFVDANCLIFLDQNDTSIQSGDSVSTYLLDS